MGIKEKVKEEFISSLRERGGIQEGDLKKLEQLLSDSASFSDKDFRLFLEELVKNEG